jgi:adenylate cyclase
MSVFHRRHQEAIAQAERAIALDPNDPNAHAAMAYALNWAGRPQEAVDSAMRAMRLDPRFPAGYIWSLGMAHFAMGQLEEAVTWLERAITLYPEVREGYSILLAPAYAHLGRDQEARTALEDYEESWEGFTPNLRDVMYWFPFKDPEVADRFADGLLKAGLAGEPAGYYKFSEEDKLSGEEIRALVFGRTISGFFPGTGHEWWMDCAEDGKSTFRGPLVELVLRDSDSDSGMAWIEGDMLWHQWQRFYPGLKVCETVFPNPEGTREMKNEYISCKDKGFMTWSPVD